MHSPIRAPRLRGALLAIAAAGGLALTAAPAGAESNATTMRHATGVKGKLGTVTIRRDSWGVPHVYASTVFGLFYGYGHSVAQDRLFQMEMARRSTQGTVAEVLGEKFVAFDKATRANFWPASIHAQIERLPRADRDILEGYAAGMNAWLDRVKADPERLMPKQFRDFGFAPAKWTAYDVAMVFVGTMANRFSDFNTELDNLALRTALIDKHGEAKGKEIFDQLKWIVDPETPTTIAPEEGEYAVKLAARAADAPLAYALPRYDDVPPTLARLAKTPDGALAGGTPEAQRELLLAELDTLGITGQAGFPAASNMWIIGRKLARGANAILLNGPQFGWFAPAYTYGIGLHGAGFDLVGNTPFAYPSVLFGTNGRITWGSTAGFGDGVDIFAEKLDPSDPTRYQHKGEWRTMEKRTETIAVKDAAPVTLDVFRTVHGVVVKSDPAQGVAYAKQRTWDGLELQSLIAWTRKGQSQNWAQWLQQAERHALTINWYYADAHGNIGYAHTGKYPERKPGHDRRLPVPGDGTMDWDGLLGFDTNPKVYNPRQGYIANWNNPPIKGYPNPDMIWLSWGAADRQHELEQRLRAKGPMDAEGMWSLLKPTSLADVNARYFLPVLRQAVAALPADDPRKSLVASLDGWDGMNADDNRDGYYDHPAPAILDAWLGAMLKATFADEVPADFMRYFGATGYPTPDRPPAGSINIQVGTKLLYQVLRGKSASVPQKHDFLNGRDALDVVRETLGQAAEKLSATYGGPVPANWKVPVARLRYFTSNFMGIPQALDIEGAQTHVVMNRGTENNMVALGHGPVRAWDVLGPGQSGFIDPQGMRSPHYADQLELFDTFGRKVLPWSAEEVRRDTRSVEQLSLPAR
ncbi:MAG: penicillin acylase [Betaproteobacteria bacterium]|nr:MAG: penicillin acylase [Betaproteobacteria bacterium]